MLATYATLLGLMAVGRAAAAAADLARTRATRADRRALLERVPAVVADALNRAAVMVFFPAVILRQARGLSADPTLLAVPAIAWALIAAGVVVGVAARRRGHDVATAAALALGLGFGNTAFLGYTLVPALLGDDALRLAVVYDQLGSFLGLSSVGLVAVSVASGGARPTAAQMAKRVVTFPPFVALVVAVALAPAWPPVVEAALVWMGRALLPAMALALGLRLRFVVAPRVRGAAAVVVVGKLLLFPALALAACALAGVDGDVRDVIVLQAAMPVMVTVGALLTFAGAAVELATAMVAWSTLVSLVTVPAWAALLRAWPVAPALRGSADFVQTHKVP